jgi:hypothetical protein
MRNSIRLVALACAGALALAFAGGAFATPKVEVFQSAYVLHDTAPLDLIVSQAEADAAPAKVQIVIPNGYGVNLSAAAGSTIGQVNAIAKATVAGTVIHLPLAGPIVTANPTDYAVQAMRCTGQALHQAVWILQLTAVGNTLPVPLYVDAGPPGVAATIQVCLPSPYIPESAGGATFGAQLLTATLHFTGIYATPGTANVYVWHVLTTPYIVGTGTPNPTATVESRAVVPYPYSLTLKRQKSKKRTAVVLGGKLSDQSGGVAGARPRLFAAATVAKLAKAVADNKAVGVTGKTNRSGNYKVTRKSSRKTTFFETIFGPVDVTSSACTAPVLAPAGCVSATQSRVVSRVVRVAGVKPKKKHRKH